MMTTALAHDLAGLSAAVAMEARCCRRHGGHTRYVLSAMRCQHEHNNALTDDDRRTLAAYYHARRTYWRDYLTTDDAAANDDHDAAAAIARGCGGAHTPWAQED